MKKGKKDFKKILTDEVKKIKKIKDLKSKLRDLEEQLKKVKNESEPTTKPTTKPDTKPAPTPTKKPDWGKPKIAPGSKPAPKAGKEEEVKNESEPATKPTTKPDTKPAPTPTKKPDWGKPKIAPGSKPAPKAGKENVYEESIERKIYKHFKAINEIKKLNRFVLNEAPMDIERGPLGEPDPTIKRGIERGEGPFGKVDIFKKKSGQQQSALEKLGSEEYNEIVRKVLETGAITSPQQFFTIFSTIQQIEAPHKSRLENLAKEVVKKYLGVPQELLDRIDVELTSSSISAPEESSKPDLDDFTPEEQEIIKSEVDKRVISNALMMGAGHRIHRVLDSIASELNSIDPRLIRLYKMLMSNGELIHWKMPFNLPSAGRMVVGKSELKFSNEESEVCDAEGEECVREVEGAKAVANIFPILLHETAKVAVEYIFAYNLPEYSQNVNKAIMSSADSYMEEHWMKLIGPRLWKYLHDAIDYIVKDRDNDYTIIAYLLRKLSALEPNEFLTLIDDVIHDGPKAIAKLEEILDEVETDLEDYETTESAEDFYSSEEDNSEEISNLLSQVDDIIIGADSHSSSKNLEDMNKTELSRALLDALEEEDFEKASIIRDLLNKFD